MGFLTLRKRIYRILPFLIGLVLGITISYGIRVLSKPTLCHHHKAVQSQSTDEGFNPTTTNIIMGNKESLSQPDTSGDDGAEESNRNNHVKENSKRERKLLFVGIMSASVFLETRAKAVWETWAQGIPGVKVAFFIGAENYGGRKLDNNETLPLVVLPGVDDSYYPPQKKSFMMLKYMYDNYGDDYEFFMRADDDVYVRWEKLIDLLKAVDSRQLYFIGQAGKGNRMEKGTLNLAHNENFCMGGPGIILSRPTMEKVVPNVDQCLKDMYSSHEDVEVGRCVQRFANISCSWSYEMQTIFYHNSSGESAFTGPLKKREVHKAITLHPVKSAEHLYRMHEYFQGLKIQEWMYEKIQLQRETLSMIELLSNSSSQVSVSFPSDFNEMKRTALKPSLNKYFPNDLDNILHWDFIMKGVYSADTLSPRLKLKSDGKEALEDTVREIIDTINMNSRARGRLVDFKDVLYGYKRINPVYGVDYILDLLLTYRKYRGRKMTVPVRRHVYVQRPFGPLQLRLLPSREPTNKATNLVMIVPLSGRYETFDRFLSHFASTCLDFHKTRKKEPSFQLSLVVVFFGSDEEKEKYLDLVQNRRTSLSLINNGSNGASICKIQVVQVDGEFSRSVALETGISQCKDEDLLLLIDVDLTFTAEAIKRVYFNTVKGEQVYFPIVFSMYSPEFLNFPHSLVNGTILPMTCCQSDASDCQDIADLGYWRTFGYGTVSFYKSDFRKTGGFDTSIKGWGKEDVSLFDRFLLRTNLDIFRAPEYEFIHVFHESECDPKLPKSQYIMCIESQAQTLGSEKLIMEYLLKHYKTGLDIQL